MMLPVFYFYEKKHDVLYLYKDPVAFFYFMARKIFTNDLPVYEPGEVVIYSDDDDKVHFMEFHGFSQVIEDLIHMFEDNEEIVNLLKYIREKEEVGSNAQN